MYGAGGAVGFVFLFDKGDAVRCAVRRGAVDDEYIVDSGIKPLCWF